MIADKLYILKKNEQEREKAPCSVIFPDEATIFEKDRRYNMWYSLKAEEHNILLQKLGILIIPLF